jgi:hypothetical protein
MSARNVIRILICFEILFGVSGMLLTATPYPKPIAAYLETQVAPIAEYPYIAIGFSIFIIVSVFFGWIGLLIGWLPAKWPYIIGHIIAVLSTPLLAINFRFPLASTLFEITHMITGATIMYLILNHYKLSLENKTLHPTADRG